MDTYEQIISGGHRTEADSLSPWFDATLRAQIEAGRFPTADDVRRTGAAIVDRLRRYREENGLSTAVVGMSGGVDSSLTAALLKSAGWRVVGPTLPINQDPEETEKGVEACEALGVEHLHLDLSEVHGRLVAAMATLDEGFGTREDEAARDAVAHVADRIGRTWFKRLSPIEFDHPTASRFAPFEALESRLFRPASVRSPDEALVKWSADISELASALAADLAEGGRRLVVAESCTAGLLGAAVAAAPGSSKILDGTILAYSSELKTDLLGVSASTLKDHTPYSAPVAEEMARGALDRSPNADVALSTTGVGGPDADQGVPAGRVFVSLLSRGGAPRTWQFDFSGAPQEVLAGTVRAALLGAREVD